MIAVLVGCAITAALAVFQHRFKAGSIPDLLCELLLLPGELIASVFHDRGNSSPEFLWRSRVSTAAILAAIAWFALRYRRSVSSAERYRRWKELTARHYRGKGFIVDFLSYTDVRYREGTRSITLSSEISKMESAGKERLGLAVYVPEPLRWDGGEELANANEQRLILSRLEAALQAKAAPYRMLFFHPKPP